MKKYLFYLFILSFSLGFSQNTLSELLNKYNTNEIPYSTVEELNTSKTDMVILDAREIKEYNVSHIKNAICVGYDHFNIETVTSQVKDKDKPIVVYCSLGIRSEDVAEQLKKEGYTNVKNLYGGIFEWKNKGYDVYNLKEKETEKVHTFSKEWSKWLKEGKKVYK